MPEGYQAYQGEVGKKKKIMAIFKKFFLFYISGCFLQGLGRGRHGRPVYDGRMRKNIIFFVPAPKTLVGSL